MFSTPKRFAAAAAAVAMTAAPVAASAAPANPAASLSVARAGAPATNDSRIAEGPTATLVSIGILAALVVIVLVATGGDDDSPDSP